MASKQDNAVVESIALLKKASGQTTEETPPNRIEHGICRVCDGTVVETFSEQFSSPSELVPFGPASQKYISRVSSGLYCENCGLTYHFLPKSMQTKQKKKDGETS